MKCHQVLICLWLVLPVCVLGSYNHNFCIDGNLVKSNDSCLISDSGVCCHSFSFLVRGLHSNLPSSSEVRIISNSLLNETIYFEYRQNISLLGYDTTLTCGDKSVNGSGLVFINITNLHIKNLVFENCGSIQSRIYNGTSSSPNPDYIASIYILTSTNVYIVQLNVTKSVGTGLIFLDTNGSVNIFHSKFEHNILREPHNNKYSGGGGVRIEFTYCASGLYQVCTKPNSSPSDVQSSYIFSRCIFSNNNASAFCHSVYSFVHGLGNSVQGDGDGGGLNIGIKGRASNIHFVIDDCIFHNNSGVWGGGLFVVFQDDAQDNSLWIANSNFSQNHAYTYGGGGACFGYIMRKRSNMRNKIIFCECLFHGNDASTSGGAISFFSNFYTMGINSVVFEKCNWTENKAQFGSAIEIAPEVWDSLSSDRSLSSLLFIDCLFYNNSVIPFSRKLNASVSDATYNRYGIGTMLISQARVQFQGTVNFTDNFGTAINAISGIIHFKSQISAVFLNNTGLNGGAISLVAYSGIIVNDTSMLKFINNAAWYQGGAIHVHSIDEHKHTSARTCFIEYEGETPVEKRNITISFLNNTTPSGDGNAIHATTFKPCGYKCEGNNSAAPYLHCIATVEGQVNSECNKGNDVTSRAKYFHILEPFKDHDIIPGRFFDINIIAQDELENEKEVHYIPIVDTYRSNNSKTVGNVSVEVYLDKSIRFFGPRGAKGKLTLANNENVLQFNFSLGACPPGYYWHIEYGSVNTCYCSTVEYVGLEKCNGSESQAYIANGYWMGYCNGDRDPEVLCTGHCPRGYCKYSPPGTNVLPTNAIELDKHICGNRTGVLCGNCRENYSAYYHSPSVQCGDETYCRWGILFYIISELVPVTVLFVIVMFVSVNFTSGKATGFILFAQIMDSISLSLVGRIYFPKPIYILLQILQVIYSFFNLDFFAVDELSFCLWKGASALDVIAMKYLTVVYALSLVVITVLAMKSSRLVRCFSCLRVRTLKTAFISGITAFLIMCYSQCTKASIEIFSLTSLYTHGPTSSRTVLFHSGDTNLFDREHLKYAVPALLFIAVIVVIPPLLLVVYPLMFKALTYCRLNEARLVTALSRLIPMQILDVFQSCYKDNFRFFAGLYFLYRTFVQMFVAAISSVSTALCVVEAFFIILLAIHAMVQPYKKKLYNIIDSLIFMNLALINGITLYNYSVILSPLKYEPTETTIAVMSSIQVVLISCPLIILVLWGCKKQLHCRSHAIVEVDLMDESTLPLLRDERNSVQ